MLRSNKFAAIAALCFFATLADAQTVSPVGGSGSGGTPANPTATAGPTAVNGSATTYMRSDAAPAVQKGSNAQFGIVEGDGSSITCVLGVCSTVAGAGNAVISPATGNTVGHAVGMSNTTTGINDLGYAPAPAGETVLVNGSNPTIAAADWAAFAQYTVIGSGRTLTIPATSTLQANGGGLIIDANAAAVTFTANAADTVTFAGATTATGGNVTLPVGGVYIASTDGAGKLYVSGNGITGTGNNVRVTSPTLVTPALGTIASGNLAAGTGYGVANLSGAGTGVLTALATNASGTGAFCLASGSSCGGSSNERIVTTGLWYWADKYPAFAQGAVFSTTTMYARTVYVPNAITIQAIGAEVWTLAAAGNCQFAIYNTNASGRPTGTVIAQTGNISTTLAVNVSGAITPVTLTANTVYFFAAMCDNTTVTFKVPGFANDTWDGYRVGVAAVGSLNASTGTSQTRFTITGQTFGTFPTTPTMAETATNGSSSSTPAFFFQAS